MSNAIASEPCPDCGSSDNLKRYDDGHAYCFGIGCGRFEPGEGTTTQPQERRRMAGDLIPAGEAIALTARKLTEETCAKWGYTVSEYGGQKVQVANYRNITGQIVGQKVRFPNKDFKFLGDIKEAGLYGQHLWRDGGKRVIITEGEIDALTVSQVQGNKWPVVSIPNGCQGAAKAVSRSMQWLLGFEEIVLMFDADEPGGIAASEVALLFPPGRCKIARLPLKDPNEMLKAGDAKGIIDAIWGAKSFRPDGVVRVGDVKGKALEPVIVGLPWYTPALTALTYGRRTGEIYALGAGTGVGKTDFITEQVQFDICQLGQKVAIFALEQQPVETVKRIAGKMAGKRFHIPDAGWTHDELVTALDALDTADNLFLYDSFGATDWDVIATTIRFLAHAEGVRIFYLDNLTALAAAEDDERTALERIMAEMGSLVKELDICLMIVSHLSTPDGKPHEEGGRVMIRHFKGSRSIGFWCHFIFGMERDQQADDPVERITTTFRCLKDRFTGQSTGEKFHLRYDRNLGRLLEVEDPSQEASAYDFGNADTDAAF